MTLLRCAYNRTLSLTFWGFLLISGCDCSSDSEGDDGTGGSGGASAQSALGEAVCDGSEVGLERTEVEVSGLGDVNGLEVVDMDGDGKDDLVLADRDNQVLRIIRNESVMGNASFVDDSTADIEATPNDLVVADFDGENGPDAAVATAASVVLLLRNDEGEFGAPTDLGIGGSSSTVGSQLTSADLNDDDQPEIIFALRGNSLLDGVSRLYVLENQGDGDFSVRSPIELAPGMRLVRVKTADVDQDDAPDIVALLSDGQLKVSGDRNPGRIAVFLNDGEGNLADPIISEAGIKDSNFGLGDLDGDGDPDISASRDPEGFVQLTVALENTGEGLFQERFAQSATPPSGSEHLDEGITLVLDINGDAFGELIHFGINLNDLEAGNFTGALFANKGDYSFFDPVFGDAGGSLPFARGNPLEAEIGNLLPTVFDEVLFDVALHTGVNEINVLAFGCQ